MEERRGERRSVKEITTKAHGEDENADKGNREGKRKEL